MIKNGFMALKSIPTIMGRPSILLAILFRSDVASSLLRLRLLWMSAITSRFLMILIICDIENIIIAIPPIKPIILKLSSVNVKDEYSNMLNAKIMINGNSTIV